MLLEVSFAMRQGEGDQRDAEIGSGTECIAGEDTQATGIGGHVSVDGDLHGEVGDQT